MSEGLEREAFERWFSDNGDNPRAVERSGAGYKLAQAQSAWVAWMAAARVEREACAKLCDDRERDARERLRSDTGAGVAYLIGAAIRSRSNAEVRG